MSEERNNRKDDNLFKKTSQEATDLFGHTVDTSGKIIKSVSGEGGLVGKTVDSSGRILKGTAGKANDAIGKTSEAPGKFYKGAKNKFSKKEGRHKGSGDKEE
ncbi:hypothetical protein MUO14_14390 [Halobacillus shinanisalinarum]|uniref:CsbD family protein n=1 Tax=Halobacillus shinanisalinarum TaxID=2932258 RepID=A0ABY4GWG1_9BACI|nr:hypothetical protein [Halobacillus shinanisalinarum]UOQ91727.1 hypothetical protein MUO14_14390 [Halobacillus shinanisalinarum]